MSRLGRFALAFGTGDREDLWNPSSLEGRFYLIVDDNFTAAGVGAGTLPKSDSNYQQIPASSSQVPDTADFVLNPKTGMERGWYLQLDHGAAHIRGSCSGVHRLLARSTMIVSSIRE